MQPIKIKIKGHFWDSFIYSGRLYLFDISGGLFVYDWYKILQNISISEDLSLAFEIAFSSSEYLYTSKLIHEIISHPRIIGSFKQMFAQLVNEGYEVNRQMLDNALVYHKDISDIGCIINDVEIYKNRLYLATANGVFHASCKKSNRNGLTKFKQIWDAYSLDLSPSYDTMAVAAGSEGCYLFNTHYNGEPTIAERENCSQVDWNYYNICCSSYTSQGYVINPSRNDEYDDPVDFDLIQTIKFDRIFSDISNENSSYQVGCKDKLYSFYQNRLRVTSINYNNIIDNISVTEINNFHIPHNIIQAKVSSFGLIIESSDSLAILQSDGETYYFDDAPINWRFFPRSTNYENQLHIITDEYLEILSFNHDAFIDQNTKQLGFKIGMMDRRRR